MEQFESQLCSKEEMLSRRASEEAYAKKVLLAQENVKIVREELTHCYMENGVNHLSACKALRDEYAALVRDPFYGAGPPTKP